METYEMKCVKVTLLHTELGRTTLKQFMWENKTKQTNIGVHLTRKAI